MSKSDARSAAASSACNTSRSGWGALAPSQAMPVRESHRSHRGRARRRAPGRRRPGRCSVSTRSARLIAQECEREVDMVRRGRAAAAFARHLARQAGRASPASGASGHNAKKTRCGLSSADRRHAATIRQAARRPSGRRAARLRQRMPLQAFATESSAFGFSKNCSSSVDPLSAVVDDCPPCTVCVTASK